MKNKEIKKYLNNRIKKEERKYNRVLDVKENQVNYLKNIDLVIIPLSQLKLEGYTYIYNSNGIRFWISCYDIDEKNECAYVVKGGRQSIFGSIGVCENYQFDLVKRAAKREGWITYKLTMIKNFNIFEARRKAQENKAGRGTMFDLNTYYINHKNELITKAIKLRDKRENKHKAYELMHKALHQLEESENHNQLIGDLENCIYILRRISQGSDYYNYNNIINELIEID